MKKMMNYSLRRCILSLLCLLSTLSVIADEVTVADANGNELIYTYETADGPATFTGIKTYSADASKAGRIIIADRVKDSNGKNHDVLYIGGSVRNRDKLVSIVFGKNIIATGGPDGTENDAFYNCSNLERVTLNSKLEILGRFTFQACTKLSTLNLEDATSLKKIMYRCFQRTALRDVTIPASVKEFDEDLFSYCESIQSMTFLAESVPNSFLRYHEKLKTINIGAGVKYIGEYAFASNYYLKTLNISSSVSDLVIGEYAFAESDRLPSVSLPKGVKELRNAVFYSCDSLRSFSFADDSPITSIPDNCFNYCVSLQKLTLPDAVQMVGNSAFGHCYAMTEITFGTGLTTLPNDWYLFTYCEKLKKVTLPGANFPFTGNIWFPNDIVFYVHADLVDTYRANDYTKSYHIIAIGQPYEFNVTTANGGELLGKIEAIGDPNNVLSLTVKGPINGTDIDVLHSLPNLRELNLTNARIVAGGDSYHQWSVASSGIATINNYYGPWNTEDNVVGYAMFYNMPSLERLLLPSGIVKIGDWGVAQNENRNLKLAYISLPAGVTEIGKYAFRATGITEVTVPAGVTRLEEYTFYDCEKLRKAVLPDDITFIGNSCFSECDSMVDVNIPAKVVTIDQYAFYNNAKRTAPIVLPATLKTIGYRAFMYNKVVKIITFNEGLETIRNYAFSNCNAVESIRLPESITTLEYNAFEGCDSITTFSFPQNIKAVPDGILYHCDKLKKVVLADGTTSLGSSAFSYCPQLNDINITTMTTLTSTGNYVFENTGFTMMMLPNSITSMGYSAFRSSANLESINVPTGLDIVPYDFVAYCEKLTSVQMHDGIRTIGHNAFLGCSSLPTIALNDQITRIEYSAFNGCSSLKLSQLPEALTHIGDAAFYGAKLFTGSLTIPAGVTRIESNAFNGTGLTAVTLPDDVTDWGTGIFANCEQLTSVKLPKNITRITNYMFQKCKKLEQIQIPDNVKEIGYAAFDQSGLTSIQLPDSLSVIETHAFSSTQLREFRIPDGIHGDPGSWTWENCKHLKSFYLGRNQDYSQLESFTCLSGCDSLQLLRIYAGTPPSCNTGYMGYRKTCVLEVPEDQVDAYKEANGWKEFLEIRGFFDGEILNEFDFAVMKKLYRELDGAHWKKPWDLSNNHRSMGKWYGVVTVGDYITAIDLSGQGLKGEICDSLFRLSHMESLNLSDNQIKGNLTTLLAKAPKNTQLTEVDLKGNALTGDIYPFAVKLPNLTKLDLSYNRLTAVSKVIPNNKLKNDQFARGFQFIDWKTRQVVKGAPVIDMRPGEPVAIESNTLQTYRHEYGDYDFTFSDLARMQIRSNNTTWDYYWELSKDRSDQWDVYSGSINRVLHAQKGQPTAYTHTQPWWSYLTYILRFDWTDGDANCDQIVDVTDLQSVVNYALNDGKTKGQMFNFTTADVNNDNQINVSDIVGSVEYVLGYEPLADAQMRMMNRAPANDRNRLTIDGNTIVLVNTDQVAALQLTISGAAARQLKVSDDVRSIFSVSMRDMTDGVRIVVYSPNGRTLDAGMHHLLSGLPAGAVITAACLSDIEARSLGIVIDDDVTSLSTLKSLISIDDAPVYDLIGHRVGPWDSLPEGIYVIRINGKSYKVKK